MKVVLLALTPILIDSSFQQGGVFLAWISGLSSPLSVTVMLIFLYRDTKIHYGSSYEIIMLGNVAELLILLIDYNH